MEHDSTKKKLFSCAMSGEWGKVIEMYKEDPWLHSAKIIPFGHTALHIAVSEGKEDVVKEMVDAMLPKALQTPNYRKNTALHLAASMGNARMCHIIANVERTLVDDRNIDGETPLFLAATHGRKQAFLCLHFIRNPDVTNPFIANCRRNNGDTILHAAINGDYFGIYIDELKEDQAYEHEPCPHAAKDNDSHGCPENYNTFWDVYQLIRKAVIVVGKPVEADAEDPKPGGDRGRENPLFPVNYKACCDLIKFFYLVLLIIFGKGSEELRKIYRQKENHTWSVQIVKKLLECAALYGYEDDGSQPQDPQDQEGYSAL